MSSNPASPSRLICPMCRREGRAQGQYCPEHRRYYVSERSLAEAPGGHPLGKLVGGKYAILGLLGRGGMGTVYWGVQHPIGRRAAIKVLRSDLTAGSAAEQRFLREAQAVASMHHPNLITCFDYGIEEDKLAYMALEYLEGATLDHFIHSYHPTLPEIVHVARQLLEGMAAFHEVSIVHRDLKPGNVMLCRVGEDDAFIKIIDFGLARLLDGQMAKTLTLQGDVFGTPLYMSPEQCIGTHDVGPESDVYAFGVMLYELLTGRTPFTGNKPMAIMMKHMNHEVPPLRPRVGVDCPPALVEFVYRCLAKSTSERYASGGAALSAFLRLGLKDSGPIRSPEPVDGQEVAPHAIFGHLDIGSGSVPPEGAIKVEVATSQQAGAAVMTAAAQLRLLGRRVQGLAGALWSHPPHRIAVIGVGVVLLLLTLAGVGAAMLDDGEQVARSIPVRERARDVVDRAHGRATVGAAQFSGESAVDEMVMKQRLESDKSPQQPPARERHRGAPLPGL